MALHQLKILPEYFQKIASGNKAWELRKNDRDFKRGDHLEQNEFDGENYTGRIIKSYVTDIFKGSKYGLAEDHCILSIRIIDIIKKPKD